MVLDESKMYRCDTPIIFKITNFNWSEPYRTSETLIKLYEADNHVHLWSAVYPAQLMDWKIRRKIKWWLVPCKNVDYSQYALEAGQLCPCNRHKEAVA